MIKLSHHTDTILRCYLLKKCREPGCFKEKTIIRIFRWKVIVNGNF